MNWKVILILLGILLLAGGFFAYQNRSFIQSIQTSQEEPESLELSPDSSWKEYVRVVINKRADIQVTASGIQIQLEPLDKDWHVKIMSVKTPEAQNTVHIVSKKLNLDIKHSASGSPQISDQKINIDTTMSDQQLQLLLNSLPEK